MINAGENNTTQARDILRSEDAPAGRMAPGRRAPCSSRQG